MEVRQTSTFRDWLANLRDARGKARITNEIVKYQYKRLGSWRSLGDDVYELKIAAGPGYRVYFTELSDELVLLLCGGDKDSQARDIRKAKTLARQWRSSDGT